MEYEEAGFCLSQALYGALILNLPSRFQEIAPPPALPQVPFSPTRAALSNAVPSRPGYGKAVELASAVMCPMKHNSTVMEVRDEEVISKIFGILNFHPS